MKYAFLIVFWALATAFGFIELRETDFGIVAPLGWAIVMTIAAIGLMLKLKKREKPQELPPRQQGDGS